MKTALNKVVLFTLFNVVNNIVQHCWAWSYNTLQLQSGVTMLNNIVDNIEQCGQHNFVQGCFHQPWTGCAFLRVRVAVSHRRRCMTLLWHLLPNGNQLLIWNCRILGCLNWKWTHWPSFWCEIFHWNQSAKQPFQKCFRFPNWSRETFYLIASFRMSNLPFFESGSFIMHLKLNSINKYVPCHVLYSVLLCKTYYTIR